MEKYYGNHLGVVIQNNDPDKSGKIKVWVPEVMSSVKEKWERTKTDKKFKFPGLNIDSDLTEIMEDLKAILPWAECAAPIVGENASGRYLNYDNKATISDSNKSNSVTPISGFQPTTNSQNDDGIGEKPANLYESQENRLNDAFTSADNKVNRPNAFSYNYNPNSYSNGAKGSFGIPNVGSHVWVFFRDGNPQAPVYFAARHGKDDWDSIYDNVDYPGTYENKSKGVAEVKDDNVERYRNKYVVNQKGGTFEIINSDGKETIKTTHYSGSFYEMNNLVTAELVTKQKQALILGDKYSTVNGFENKFVGKSSDENIRGDRYIKIGKLNESVHIQWKEIAAGIADIKQRFDLQRAEAIEDQYIKKTSVGQKKSGTPAPNPALNQSIESLNNEFGSVKFSTVKSTKNEVTSFANVEGDENEAESASAPPLDRSTQESEESPSSMDGEWSPDPDKEQLQELIKAKVTELADIEKKLGVGGNEVIDITKHKVETIGLVMNDFGSMRLDLKGKMYNNEVLVDDDGVYDNKKESPLVEYVHVDDLPGGSYTLNICNRWNVQVGAGGVNLASYGPVNISGTITNIAGEQVNIASENEVNIEGGKRLTISADILVLRQKNQRQVMVDSSLGISKNLIIGGGIHVEGELFCQHITAPLEIHETEQVELFGELVSGKVIGQVIVTGGSSAGTYPVRAVATPDSVKTYKHSHNFANAAMTLLKSNKLVRMAAKALNQGIERVVASGTKHQKKS